MMDRFDQAIEAFDVIVESYSDTVPVETEETVPAEELVPAIVQ